MPFFNSIQSEPGSPKVTFPKCFTWFPDNWPSVASLTAGEVKSEEQRLCEARRRFKVLVFLEKATSLHKSGSPSGRRAFFAFGKRQNALARKHVDFLFFSLRAEKKAEKKKRKRTDKRQEET